jgi:alpha-tubulin suppressor-like RCC1 family protein
LSLDGEKTMPWRHPELERQARATLEAEGRVLLLWERCSSLPVPLHLSSPPVAVATVACGAAHAAAVTAAGELFTWGANEHGQLGRGTPQGAFPAPERALFALHLSAVEPRVVAVSCGARHTVAVTEASLALAFGDNSSGQCGYAVAAPNRKVNLMTLGEGTNVPLYAASVCCGAAHTFALAVHGELFACGDNSCGQLGVGDLQSRAALTLVTGLLGVPVAAVGAGALHSACVTVSGNVFVWGSNSHGQLGVADAAVSVAPFWLQFFCELGAASVSCAANHTLVLCCSGAA